MKHPRILGLLCAASLFLGIHPASAQEDFGPPPGGPGGGGPPPGKEHRKFGPPHGAANLSPGEAQKLAQAREKVKNDPSIKSLRQSRDAIEEQLQNAMNAAILAADPSLAPVLERIKQSRARAKDMSETFESLTSEQKEALKAAREAAKQDPAVVAARQKMKSATDPQAKREAGREMHQVMKAAMLKQNPSLAPLLEKMGPPPGGGPGGPGDLGGPQGPPPPDEE